MTLKLIPSLFITILIVSASSFPSQTHLLQNCQLELQKMIAAHDAGDTSLAFSIAVKVYFAVQFLHNDL
jgi:hypothetical protein